MTRKRKCQSKSNSFVAAAEQVCLQLFLNTDSDEADVTSLGRPFHTFAPATGKARPPIVDRRLLCLKLSFFIIYFFLHFWYFYFLVGIVCPVCCISVLVYCFCGE